MKTSERGVAFIAAQEGVVTRAYRDVAGVWTIGIGHTAAAGPPKPVAGMTISRADAFRILADDLGRVFEPRVRAALGEVPQPVFDGAVSFDFNTGAIDRASWVKHLRAGRRAEAERALKLWNRAGGRIVAGLVRRRAEEADLIFRGDHGATAPAGPERSAEVGALQADLAALGFDPGPVDGIAGPRTKAAILAYQRSHPDLVADGIAGPATRASLARDRAARASLGGAAAAVAIGSATAALGADAAGEGTPFLWGLAALAALALVLGAVLVRRHGAELGRLFAALLKLKGA
ncbi:MAG TPA: peptidoglycan-binding protein [Bauldia sp.]|nr:peptidoglycan-binding protein [Bauldia sp.]